MAPISACHLSVEVCRSGASTRRVVFYNRVPPHRPFGRGNTPALAEALIRSVLFVLKPRVKAGALSGGELCLFGPVTGPSRGRRGAYRPRGGRTGARGKPEQTKACVLAGGTSALESAALLRLQPSADALSLVPLPLAFMWDFASQI